MSSFTVCNSDQLILQNIITINQSALVQNFKLLHQCMGNFKGLTEKISQLEKTNKSILDEMDRMKKKQEKDIVEMKSGLKEVQTETREITKRDSLSRTAEKTEDMSKPNFQQSIMEHLSKELQIIRTNSQAKAASDSSIEQQIDILRREITNIKVSKVDTTEFLAIRDFMKEDSNNVQKLTRRLDQITKDIAVLQQQQSVDYTPKFNEIKNQIIKEVDEINRKIKMKSDQSDLVKLEDLLIGMIDHGINLTNKKFADRLQTKKGLVFLEKRINKVVSSLFGDDDDKDALFATKGWKCISCTKDLKEYEGRLDKFKPWAIFPAKEMSKDKYPGFGVGFQNVVEKAVEKKGVEPTFDTYGRMTTPFNLTRQVNIGSNKSAVGQTPTTQRGMSTSQSTTLKTAKQTANSNAYLQTNFMNHFGTGIDTSVNIRDEYKTRFAGIEQYLRISNSRQ